MIIQERLKFYLLIHNTKLSLVLVKDYQLDLRESKFGDLIGFEEKIVDKEEIGSKLPNITNSIDVIYLNTDAISDSLLDGISITPLQL